MRSTVTWVREMGLSDDVSTGGAAMERGHPVRLSAKREQPPIKDPMWLSVLRTLADRMSALHRRSRF
ncbi:MAG TPA: hypothetical protein VK475_00060 [Pyrinomonadaceae bacterium]|nr:hypothetical protein [Pyrinomonadaceae bacterium]